MIQLNTTNISKNKNDFSFTDKFIENINNKNFKNNVFYESLSCNNEYSNIYNTISAISEDIGNKFYEETLNYIDNIGNIDTCKIKALQSILNMIGLKYNIFDIINTFPIEILEIINIFSIRPDYLINSNKISKYICDSISSLCQQNDYITVDNIDKYAKELLYTQFKNICLHTYYNDNTQDLNILTNEKTYLRYINNNHNIIEYSTEHTRKILNLKILYKINKQFDERKIVNNIEYGIVDINQFSENEQIILYEEINYRKSAYNFNILESRYKFFKEQLVQKYIDSIEYIYTNLNNNSIQDYYVYELDQNYIYGNNKAVQLLKLDNHNLIIVDFDIIKVVTDILVDIIKYIRTLRITAKTYIQKNYMKGTFLLLSYVINEYLKQNFNISSNQISEKDIELIEYYDTTNYFNISTDIDNKYNLTGTNSQYWNTDTAKVSTFIDLDITNIFSDKSNILIFENYLFTQNEIEDFYKHTLNLDFLNLQNNSYSENLNNFLSTIFDFAASKLFLSNDVIYPQIPNLSNANVQLFNKYSQSKNSYTPYFYYTNSIHPSYQIHPYLKSFITHKNYINDIENTVFLFDNTINTFILNNIDDFINSYGYLKNIQYNPYNFNQTYLTQYEKISQKYINNIEKNPAIGYDGFVYPTALRDYIENIYNFANLNEIDNIWYKQLTLSYNEKEFISKQLMFFKDYIFKIAGVNNDYYDIYKYGKDIFGNSYILIKKYETDNIENISEDIKTNTPGTLWVRYKNHPIAFPFICYQNKKLLDISQIETTNESLNPIFINALNHAHKEIDNLLINMPAVYDFQILDNQQTIILKTCDIKNNNINIIPLNIQLVNNSNIKYRNEIVSITVNDNKIELLNNIKYKNIYRINDTKYIGIFIQQDETKLNISGVSFENTNSNLIQFKNNVTSKIDISCEYDIDNIQIDINDNKLYIAHLSSTENIYNLTTYFQNKLSVEYLQLSSYIDVFDNSIIIREFNIERNIFSENINNKTTYLPLTDMGFYPLIEHHLLIDNYISELDYTTYNRAKKLDKLLKFQIIGKQIPEGIKFRFISNIVKKFTNNNNIEAISAISYYPYTEDSTLQVFDYRYTSFIADKLKTNIDFQLPIFCIHDLYNQLSSNIDYIDFNKSITVNRLINNGSNNIIYDQFVDFPYLINDENVPAHFETPGTFDKTQLSIDNNILLQCTTEVKITSNYTSPLSVTWLSTEFGIKIDFNATYFYNKIANNVENLFNYQHTFLNLDRPNESGYLKIYNQNLISAATSIDDFDNPDNIIDILYIKNISDTFPKFILSSVWFDTDTINTIDILASNEYNVTLGQTPNILVNKIIENNEIEPIIL